MAVPTWMKPTEAAQPFLPRLLAQMWSEVVRDRMAAGEYRPLLREGQREELGQQWKRLQPPGQSLVASSLYPTKLPTSVKKCQPMLGYSQHLWPGQARHPYLDQNFRVLFSNALVLS